MSAVFEELAEAFREHRSAFGVSLVIAGTTVIAVVEESEFSRELAEGGFAEAGAVKAECLASDFSSVPGIGAAASWNGRSFRVASVSTHPASPVVGFSLRPANR